MLHDQEDPVPFETLLRRGLDVLAAGQAATARDCANAALELQPDNESARNLLALALLALGDVRTARESFVSLLARHPEEVPLRINVALAALQLGDRETALAELREAVARDPGHPVAFGYLALVHLERGEQELASAALREAGLGTFVPLVKAASEPAAIAAAAAQLRRHLATQQAEHPAPASFVEARLAAAALPLARHETEPHRVTHLPAGAAPLVEPPLAELALAPPGPAAQLVDELLLLRLGSGRGQSGEAGRVVVRQDLQIVQLGPLEWNPLDRRRKGGNAGPFVCEGTHLMLARGTGGLVLHPRPGEHFHLLHLRDQAIYLREQVVAAFDGELFWENGRIPQTRADDPELVNLRGSGFVALHGAGRLVSLAVTDEQVCVVALDRLLGWSSELVPQHVDRRENKPHVGFAGRGVVWLLLLRPTGGG